MSQVGKTLIMPSLDLKKIKSETMVENPFPEIGGILFDEEKMKVFCTHYRSKEDTMRNIEEDKIQIQMNK